MASVAAVAALIAERPIQKGIVGQRAQQLESRERATHSCAHHEEARSRDRCIQVCRQGSQRDAHRRLHASLWTVLLRVPLPDRSEMLLLRTWSDLQEESASL